MGEDVVVTGLGAVSAAGIGTVALGSALRSGRACLTALTRPGSDALSFRVAGQVQESETDRMDPVSRFAVIAAKEAMAAAALPERDDVAVIIGTGGGGLESIDAAYHQILALGRTRPSPLTVPKGMPSAPTSAVAAALSLRGLSFGITSACASASHAIGIGASLLRSGQCSAAIVGGSEAPLSLGHLRAWDSTRAVSADTCRPFSRERSGMSLGEGAAVLVIERESVARARGAAILARVLGFGASSGDHELTRPSAESYQRAMRRALDDARLPADAIDYVHAHGTGTKLNDLEEARALHAVFGTRALPVSSIKGMLGHTIGASGALSVVATVLAMRAGYFPPTTGFTTPDPECALDIVGEEARPGGFARALCNNFAFGDLNACLVIGSA